MYIRVVVAPASGAINPKPLSTQGLGFKSIRLCNRYRRLGWLVQLIFWFAPIPVTEYIVICSLLDGSSGLVSAQYSCRLVCPSPSLSPLPLSVVKLPTCFSSQLSGSPSPSVSTPGAMESVCTKAKALLRLIQPTLALQTKPLSRPLTKSILGPWKKAPLASRLVKLTHPMFAP